MEVKDNIQQPFLQRGYDYRRGHSIRTQDQPREMSVHQDDSRSQGNSSSMDSGSNSNEHYLDSTDTTLVLLYNFKEQKYQFLLADKLKLQEYYNPVLFEKKVLSEIIKDPRRMPFTQQISFPFQFLIKSIKYLIFLAFVVACFYLLVYMLLNPIVLVIQVCVAIWFFLSLIAFEEKIYFWVRNQPLNKFIAKINHQEDILTSGILVVAGEEGKWIEIELQERGDQLDRQFDDPDIYDEQNNAGSPPTSPVTSQRSSQYTLRVAYLKRPNGRTAHGRQDSYKIEMGETPRSSVQKQGQLPAQLLEVQH